MIPWKFDWFDDFGDFALEVILPIVLAVCMVGVVVFGIVAISEPEPKPGPTKTEKVCEAIHGKVIDHDVCIKDGKVAFRE